MRSVGEFAPVAPGVYVATAEPATVNLGLIVGSEGCLIVDTGSSPEQGAQLRERAERVAGVPVSAVLVTHWHYDHLFGLAAFADVPSYAHASVADWLSRPECHAEAAELEVDPAALIPPSHPFFLAKTIDLGDRHVELVHFGPGHTDGDAIAHVPQAGVVFTGDLLENDGPPQFGEDCHFKYWPSAVDGILGLVSETTVLVPGHGAVMDRMDAFRQRAEISGLYGQAEHLRSRGVRLSDAYSAGTWPFEEATVNSALPLLYRQLAAEGGTSRTQLPLV